MLPLREKLFLANCKLPTANLTSPPLDLRRERDFGAKINATFQFAVRQGKPLLTCLLYLVVPLTLLVGVFGGLFQSKIFSFSPTQMGQRTFISSSFLTPDYWLMLLFSVFAYLLLSLTVYAYLAEYEAAGNQAPGVAAVWVRVRRSLLPAAGVALLLGLGAVLIVGGLVGIFAAAGIIPMAVVGGMVAFGLILYWSVAYSLSFAVLVQDEVGVMEALQRSAYLVDEKWWSTFGLSVAMGLITGVLGYAFQVPLLVVTVLKGLQVLKGEQPVLFIIASMLTTIGTTLLRGLVTLALGFQYYNLVEMKEGPGLLADLERLGQKPTPTLFPGEESDF